MRPEAAVTAAVAAVAVAAVAAVAVAVVAIADRFDPSLAYQTSRPVAGSSNAAATILA